VAAPLPGPIRARQERKAGYEAAAKDVAKWIPLVKANREAPTLRFAADRAAVPRTASVAALAARHAPETAMEAEVAALLEAAGAHTARAVAEAERALAAKELTVEEAAERQGRLARMRALLFYHEVKARRLKKIKSKDHRRRLKRAERKRAADGGAGDDDGGEGGADALRRDREEAEFERAKERLTLKHRNTSRFIRRALKRGTTLVDDGVRGAVEEQLRLGKELRNRVRRLGPQPGESSGTDASDGDTSASDSDASDGEGGGQGQAQGGGVSARARKAALELLEGGGPLGGEDGAPATGLFALPFMQRALEKKRRLAQEEAAAVLEGGGGGGGAAPSGSGRRAFGGTDAASRAEERARRLEAAALNSDSEFDSDAEEDAEAKAARLGRKLRGEPEPQAPAAAPAGQASGSGDASARAGASSEGARPGMVTTDGPVTLALPAGRRGAGAAQAQQRQGSGAAPEAADRAEEDVMRQVLRQRGRVAQQAELFAPAPAAAAERGKKRGAGEVTATVGPAGAARADLQQPQQQQPGDGQPAFAASKKFQGARPGCVFKKGPEGTGYYADDTQAARAARDQQRAERAAAKAAAAAAAAAVAEEEEGGGHVMRPSAAPSAGGGGLSQEELVRRAFAGDDVAAEFAADKAAEVEGELPSEEVPGSLPGWGTWASSQREPRWAAAARAGAAARKASAAAARQDAGLQYVVISEKWDRRNAKYRTPSLPYPYDSKDTYERAMRQPLGREFNTDASFRDLTRPAVLKDAGVIIEPIRYSAAVAEHEGKAGKGAKRAAVLTVAGGMPKRSKKKA
jgi:U3 small nucleolar RNA-associated protein 14